MSSSRLQPIDPLREESADLNNLRQAERQRAPRSFVIPDRPFQVGDVLPAVCGVTVVAWIFDVTPSQVHKWRKAGKLAPFVLQGDFGPARYCGRKLQQWASGDLAGSFVNGDLRSPRAFGRRSA